MVMKAISLFQPWASLWCSPAKTHETRGRRVISQPGWLAVHASKTLVADVPGELAAILTGQFGVRWYFDLPRGAIVGAVEVIQIKASAGTASAFNHDDLQCGDFTAGRILLQRLAFKVLADPIPWRGRQMPFDLPAEIAARIAAAPLAANSPGRGV